jgi:hypothetical protein
VSETWINVQIEYFMFKRGLVSTLFFDVHIFAGRGSGALLDTGTNGQGFFHFEHIIVLWILIFKYIKT